MLALMTGVERAWRAQRPWVAAACVFVTGCQSPRSAPAASTNAAAPASAATVVSAEEKQESVVFPARRAVVGQTSTRTRTTKSRIVFQGLEAHPQNERIAVVLEARVIAVGDNGEPTKLEVHVATNSHETWVEGGGKKSKEGPLVGRTLVLERGGNEMTVTVPDGQPAERADVNDIVQFFSTLGTPSVVLTALQAKPRHVGDALDDVAAAFSKAIFDPNATMNMGGLTLVRVESSASGRFAVLEGNQAWSGNQGGLTSRSTLLRARVCLDAPNAGATSVESSWTLEITGKQPGSGTIEVSDVTTP